MEQVRIEKLVHGGQGLASLADGRRVFVWNALPGETVAVRLLRKKASYAEAVAETIIEPSPHRQAPKEPVYLATSPWQIMPLDYENNQKAAIVRELFRRENVTLPEFEVYSNGRDWHYRNKMEYSFYGDEQGLHLALYNRGSHQKMIVDGSVLAMPAVDSAARALLQVLQTAKTRAGDLKSVIIRSSQDGTASAVLYVKPDQFDAMPLPAELQSLSIYHSNPKSPASVPTRLLHQAGNPQLADTLLGHKFVYTADAFFQVNVSVYETTLNNLQQHLPPDIPLVDMYAGVGSIGLSMPVHDLTIVEVDAASAAMARHNAAGRAGQVRVIEAPAEHALDYIRCDAAVIVDPPRAGLHQRVTERLLEVRPPVMAYLSCNPATQTRDIALLSEGYTIKYFTAFNYFPHTPHIETLAVLQAK